MDNHTAHSIYQKGGNQMTRKNVKVLSVHLNKTKEDDISILAAVDKKNFNFSGYVKKLILDDIKKKELQKQLIKQKGSIKYLPKNS
jgi:hypothetical protein